MPGTTKLLLFVLISLGQNGLGSEIIHGKKVPENLMTYMASLQNSEGHKCGGFLISEEFVLTAAHCDRQDRSVVVLGTHNLKKVSNDTRYGIAKKCKHPDFTKVKEGSDIMLLKLSRKAALNDKVQRVKLPTTNDKIKDKAKCRVAGWGRTKAKGGSVDVLEYTEVPITNLDFCKKEWNESSGFDLPKNVICTGGAKVKTGFCQMDSGGPLVCSGKAVGVVSFNMRGNCDYPNAPNVYTDISKYMKWINDVLKKKNC